MIKHLMFNTLLLAATLIVCRSAFAWTPKITNSINTPITIGDILTTNTKVNSVIALDRPVISYVTPQIFTVGTAVNLLVSNAGGAVQANGYTISAPLPAGLTLDATTGTISGTPTAIHAATFYTVTAINADGLSQATINIKVALPQSVITAPAISYETPKVYPPNIAITPLVPVNTGGEIKKYSPGLIRNFAGTGSADIQNGPKNIAEFNSPSQLVFDGTGNIFLTDINNFAIRNITTDGIVSTYAGGNGQGGTNGLAKNVSQFNAPRGIVMDSHGNIFVADKNAIRKITPAGAVTNFAGGTVNGYADGIGSAASFDGVVSLAIDQADNIYVADQNNLLIRKITPAGVVTTLAGNKLRGHIDGQSSAATFDGPAGITIDAAGNLYVADYLTIRKITPTGFVTTIAGNGTQTVFDGPALSASFGNATGITISPAGEIYILDIGNNVINEGSDVLRLLNVNGVVSTVDLRLSGSTRAFLSQPTSLTFNNDDLYITGNNNFIQTISFDKYTIDKALPAGLTFDKYTGIISGTPTALSPPTNYTVTANNTGGINTTVVNIQVKEIGSLQPSIISFPAIAAKTLCDADFGTDATSTNTTTTITYTSSNEAVATVSAAGIIHIVGVGTTNITASQSGSAIYNSAAPVSQLLTVITTSLNNFPVVTISASAVAISAGTNVTFTATTVNTADVKLYQWQVNGNNTGTNSESFSSSTLQNGDRVTCTVTFNNNTCIAPVTSNELTTTISPQAVVIPANTFTPNNDGINDTWKIPALVLYPDCQVSIFNRNGTLLMQSTGYNKPWDGTHNGKQLPAGVYYYVIDTRDGKTKLSGSVTIIQ